MTERMENALNHIKTSADVDPWAMEEVERVFNMQDALFTIVKTMSEIEKGRWTAVDTDVYYDLMSYRCSECGSISLERGRFCPSCGCRMENEG